MARTTGQKCKYSQIYEDLLQAIKKKQYPYGAKLPSEIKLAESYSASRPTVAHALADLQDAGLVQRRMGSGTYVTYQEESRKDNIFGLLIPGLGEGEIFEPICSHMTRVAEEKMFTLIWGGQGLADATGKCQQVEQQCYRFIQQKVDGIFFNPLELTAEKDAANSRIAHALTEANIPVVLLDQDCIPFPERSRFDLVGINNFQSGAIITRHLLDMGCKRIDFVARPFSASTIDIRIGGYHEALVQAGIQPRRDWVHWGDPDDPHFVKTQLIDRGVEAVICANDAIAAALMHNLVDMGVKIPQDLRLAGYDDVKYAEHLRVPLTTYRQPCRALAAIAVHTMLTRIVNPDLPPRTIYVDGELVVRRSSDPHWKRKS